MIAPESRPASRAAASMAFRLVSYWPGVILVGSQPSPWRPVSSSMRGPCAAVQIGGCGRERAQAEYGPVELEELALEVDRSSARHSRLITSMPSASRATGLSHGSP